MGMVSDVGDFIWVQAKIQRMQNATSYGNTKVGFKMNIMIPHQRSYALSTLKASGGKALGQPPSALVEIRIGVAMKGAVGQARDNLLPTKHFSCPLQHRRQSERIIHHGVHVGEILQQRGANF